MKLSITVCVASVFAASVAFAQANKEMKQGGQPAMNQGQTNKDMKAGNTGMPAMDFSKMGPNARKPTNEARTKKEIAEFFKQEEELMKKGDMQAMIDRHDFPIYMATDDLKGVPEAKEYGKDEYVQMMKPFWENMPKDAKTTHKPTVTVLSDSLVNVVDDFTMTMGKQKVTGKNMTLLVKRNGQWKWKAMVEAGWGGDMGAGSGGSGEAK